MHPVNLSQKTKEKILVVSGSQFRALKMYGLDKKLAGTVDFVYGPGCVLCTAGNLFYHTLIKAARQEKTIVATGPNYLKIPGNGTTLEKERQKGLEIHTVYTIQDVLLLAKHKRGHKIVFPALGFETMTAATAAAVLQAKVAGLFNFSVLNGHRPLLPLVEKFLSVNLHRPEKVLFSSFDVKVMGTKAVEAFAIKHHLHVAVTGEADDQLVDAVETLLNKKNTPLYIDKKYLLKPEGEIKSQQLINEVFEAVTDDPNDPFDTPYYAMANPYALHNAEQRLHPPQKGNNEKEDNSCICRDILTGSATPAQCLHFKKECNPLAPLGACMASPEGLCQIEYLYS